MNGLELTNEEIVTRILSENQILRAKKEIKRNMQKADFNLGSYLEKIKNAPSKYGAKYVFVK